MSSGVHYIKENNNLKNVEKHSEYITRKVAAKTGKRLSHFTKIQKRNLYTRGFWRFKFTFS